MDLSENPTLEEIINEAERLNNLVIDRGDARTITPSTTNQVLSKGNYKGDITILGDSDLIASNILNGKSIFGVEGSVISGRRYATGKVLLNSSQIVDITNLAFTPRVIHVYTDTVPSTYTYNYASTLGDSSLNKASSYCHHPDYRLYGQITNTYIKPNGFYCETGYQYYKDYVYWIAYE